MISVCTDFDKCAQKTSKYFKITSSEINLKCGMTENVELKMQTKKTV